MDFRLSIDSDRLKLIASFSEELTYLLHKYIDICPDFDHGVHEIHNHRGETIGTVETNEDAVFEFFPAGGSNA